MKDIKFRAWDKSENRMHENVQTGIYQDPDETISFEDILNLARFELMQYTGLKDKNGKEIYEGDICRYFNPEDKDGICEIEEDYALWISGTIKETNLLTPLFYLKCSSEWEVIGNIHEHSHLLK